MNKIVKNITNDLMGIWIGFCLGWLWFTEDSFLTIIFYEFLGLILISFSSWVVNIAILYFKEKEK